jgi:hypothetical protein
MKTTRIIPALCGLLATALCANAQSFAPVSIIGNTLLNSTITGSTGGENSDGTFSDLLSVNGMDYTVTMANALTAPAPYTYASSGPDVGVLTEGSLAVTLTFTSANGGTFLANYGSAGTQSGTFNLTSLGVPTALNSLVQGTSLINASDLMNLNAGTTSTVGFVVGGSTPLTVLVRAAGPGLAQFGVKGTLATPTITMTNGAGAVVATNTGWNNSAALQTAFTEAGAFNFASGSADSAIVETLAPGNYTAQVSSTSATDTGEVLVEIYVIP